MQGAVLAARVRITIASGLVDLNRLLRQATVRRNIVVQLIRMRRDAGHPDYVDVDMQRVQSRAELLASTDEPTAPSALVQFLEGEDDIAGELFSGVDKAATPAERVYSEAELRRNMEQACPQTLMSQ